MMYLLRFSFLFFVFAIGCVGYAHAGITLITFTGPGGSGFADFSQGNHTNAIFDIDYSALAHENIAVTVNGAGTYTLHASPPDFYVLNVSHESWKAFTISTSSNAILTGASEVPDPNTKPKAADHFANISTNSRQIAFFGGPGVIWDSSNPNQNSLTFFPSFTFTTSSAGTFDFVATPHLNAVPEPSSIVLVGTAVSIGLVAIYRSRRRLIV